MKLRFVERQIESKQHRAGKAQTRIARILQIWNENIGWVDVPVVRLNEDKESTPSGKGLFSEMSEEISLLRQRVTQLSARL